MYSLDKGRKVFQGKVQYSVVDLKVIRACLLYENSDWKLNGKLPFIKKKTSITSAFYFLKYLLNIYVYLYFTDYVHHIHSSVYRSQKSTLDTLSCL